MADHEQLSFTSPKSTSQSELYGQSSTEDGASPGADVATSNNYDVGMLQQQVMIEIDGNGTSDSDSAYFGDDASSFASDLPSMMARHVYENDRRYHGFKEGRYAFPNDAGEKEREEAKHDVTVMITGGRLHIAQIGSHPQSILDIGTGFGYWAVEMGEKYPSARIIGTDLSPVQPTWVPPNVQFEIEDCEDEAGWPYKDDEFDFVHIRYMFAAIRDWRTLIAEAYRVCEPGGWVEFCEFITKPASDDGSIPENSKVSDWLGNIHRACAMVGLDTLVAPKLKVYAREAGFENVREQVYKLPLGSWPKDKNLKLIGHIQREQISNGASGLSMAIFTRILGWSPEEVEEYLVGVREELTNPKIHSYWPT